MLRERLLSRFAGLAYDAALDPLRWNDLLVSLQGYLNFQCGVFYVRDFTKRHASFHAQLGLREGYQQSYEQYYCRKNAFLSQGVAHRRPGRLEVDAEICEIDKLHRSEFYNEWLVPQDLDRGVGALVLRDGSQVSVLALIQRRGRDVLSGKHFEFVQALLPHMQTSTRLHYLFSDMRDVAGAGKRALDHWSTGIFLLDATGRVLLMNRGAEAFTQPGRGLKVTNLILEGETSRGSERLRRLIRGALLDPSSVQGLPPGGRLTLARPASRRPLSLAVAPARAYPDVLPALPAARVIVLVTDPDLEPEPSVQALKRRYRLTEAETRVACLMVQGFTVQDVAEMVDSTPNTVSTHLKNIRDKTGIRRQADLVRLLGPLL